MKRLYTYLSIIILSSIFTGCMTVIPDVRENIYGGISENIIDFTDYAEKGFTFSPYEPISDYESLGLLEFEISEEMFLIEDTDFDKIDKEHEEANDRYGNGVSYQPKDIVINGVTYSLTLIDRSGSSRCSSFGCNDVILEGNGKTYSVFTYVTTAQIEGQPRRFGSVYLKQIITQNDFYTMVDEMYKRALGLGANSVYSFEFNQVTEEVYLEESKQSGLVLINSYRSYGIAVDQ